LRLFSGVDQTLKIKSKIVGDYYLIINRKSADCVVGRAFDRRHEAYLKMVEKLLP
jgi:hypothetical protein